MQRTGGDFSRPMCFVCIFAAFFGSNKGVLTPKRCFQIWRHTFVFYTHDFCGNVPAIRKIKVCGAHRRRSMIENTPPARHVANFRISFTITTFLHKIILVSFIYLFCRLKLQKYITNGITPKTRWETENIRASFIRVLRLHITYTMCIDALPSVLLSTEKPRSRKIGVPATQLMTLPKAHNYRGTLSAKKHRMPSKVVCATQRPA